MDINLLVNLKNNLVLPNTVAKSKGLSINEIEDLEKKYNQGREFVKAFREYLYLAGDYFNGGFDTLGEGLDELQKIAEEDILKTKQQINKSYFAFNVLDSMYSVILLDEDAEDPKVYLIDPYGFLDGDTPLIRTIDRNFTALVNERIRRVKNNLPM